MSVTIVTTIVRCACAVERTIHQLREIVNGIAADVDDRINTFRDVQLIRTCRKVENKYVRLGIKAGRNGSFDFSPSAAALSLQDCIGSLLRKFITGIRTGNHSCLSLTEVSGNAFYEMIRIRTETITVTMNIRCRGNLKVTAESIDLVKIQLTCYRELGKSFFTGSRIASRKRILSLELGISADREST